MSEQEKTREWRFYVTLCMGYGLLILGCLLPPMGVIENSVIFGSGLILALSAMIIGIDLTRIIRELRQLNKEFRGSLVDSTSQGKEEEEESSSNSGDKYKKRDTDETQETAKQEG